MVACSRPLHDKRFPFWITTKIDKRDASKIWSQKNSATTSFYAINERWLFHGCSLICSPFGRNLSPSCGFTWAKYCERNGEDERDILDNECASEKSLKKNIRKHDKAQTLVVSVMSTYGGESALSRTRVLMSGRWMRMWGFDEWRRREVLSRERRRHELGWLTSERRARKIEPEIVVNVVALCNRVGISFQ